MFTILLQTLQTLILFSVFTVLWRLLSQIMKSSLRDLSGPPWSSFISGVSHVRRTMHRLTCTYTSGNLKELYGPNVIWHRTMTRTYGRVFKIHGMFGVSACLLICNFKAATNITPRASKYMLQISVLYSTLLSRINTHTRWRLRLLSKLNFFFQVISHSLKINLNQRK